MTDIQKELVNRKVLGYAVPIMGEMVSKGLVNVRYE